MDLEAHPLVKLQRAIQRLIRCIGWVLGGRPYVWNLVFQCTSCGEVIVDEPVVIESYKIEPEWWLQLRTCDRCGPEEEMYEQWLAKQGMN